MLGRIKRLFGAGHSKPDEIPFQNIDMWLETKLKESDLSKNLSEVFSEINKTVVLIDIAVKRIVKKVLADIAPEHKNVVENNREEYITKMQEFIKQTTPDKKDVESIINYAETLAVSLKNINEQVKNNMPFIQKLFPEQSDEIENSLEDLKNLSQEINSLVKTEFGVSYAYDAKKRIMSIRKKKKALEGTKSLIEKERIKQKEAEDYKIKLETDFDNLKTMYEYEKYDELMSQRIRLEKEIERESEHIRLLFTPLSKILSKYEGEVDYNRSLARQYAEDPLAALHNDKDLWILNLLQIISSKLPEIIQDEGKRIKLREAIMKVTEGTLKSYLTGQKTIKENLEQVKKQLLINNTTTKMEDIKYKMNHAIEQLSVSEENIKKHEKAISELDIGKDLLMLEKKLSLLHPVKII